MKITLIKGGQMPAVTSIKRRQQASFKGNVVEKPAKQQDQKAKRRLDKRTTPLCSGWQQIGAVSVKYILYLLYN